LLDEFPHIEVGGGRAPLQADLNVTFAQKIRLFYFTEFGISVSKEKFSILRET